MQRGLAALTVSGVALLVGTTFTACGSSSSQPGGGGDGGGSDGAASSGGGSSGAGSSSGKGGSSGAGSSSGKGGSSGTGSSSGAGSSSGTGGSSGTGSSSGSDGGGAYDPSVYQHHKNGTRDGLYIDPAFTQAAHGHRHAHDDVRGDGHHHRGTRSQLYVQNGPGGVETFLVATEDNHVTTFNATTGTVIWDTDPSIIGPYATQNPPGGSVGPANIGVTGTPFIDIGSRTVFFDAMVTPDQNASYHHTVFALSLDTGHVLTNWPVDVNTAAPGFDSGIQNQRGALQFLNGVLYVPGTAATTATAARTTDSGRRLPRQQSAAPSRGGTRPRPRAASGAPARCRRTARTSIRSRATPRGPTTCGAAARPSSG